MASLRVPEGEDPSSQASETKILGLPMSFPPSVPTTLRDPGQALTGASFCPHSGVFCLEERKEMSFQQPLAFGESLSALKDAAL